MSYEPSGRRVCKDITTNWFLLVADIRACRCVRIRHDLVGDNNGNSKLEMKPSFGARIIDDDGLTSSASR